MLSLANFSARTLAAALAGAIGLSSVGEVSAAPISPMPGLAGLSASQAPVVDVRYVNRRRVVRRYRRGYGYGGGAAVLGVLGLAAGAAIVAGNRRHYDDGDYGYGYGQRYGYYDQGYAAPVYSEPYYDQPQYYRTPRVYNQPRVYQQAPVYNQPRVYQQAPAYNQPRGYAQPAQPRYAPQARGGYYPNAASPQNPAGLNYTQPNTPPPGQYVPTRPGSGGGSN